MNSISYILMLGFGVNDGLVVGGVPRRQGMSGHSLARHLHLGR